MNVRREEEHIHRLFGGDSEKDPPVSMPNTEVKLLSAESTCLDTDRKDRTPPNFYSSLAQSVEPAAVNRVVVGSSPTGGAMISDEIAVTNKKDGFYANPPFLLQFFRII